MFRTGFKLVTPLFELPEILCTFTWPKVTGGRWTSSLIKIC